MTAAKPVLRWRAVKKPSGGLHSHQARCGALEVSVSWDLDSSWTYTVAHTVFILRQFGDYQRSFTTAERAKLAAEAWLRGELKKMNKSMRLLAVTRSENVGGSKI